MCVYIYICIERERESVYVCMCVYIYIYIYTHTHTYSVFSFVDFVCASCCKGLLTCCACSFCLESRAFKKPC